MTKSKKGIDDKLLNLAISGALDTLKSTPLTLEAFIDDVLRHYMEQEPGDYVPLGQMHAEWADIFEGGTHTAIICARGHLKPSWGLSALAYQMAMQPNYRALYLSATLEQAWDKLEQFEEICRRSWRLNSFMKARSEDEKVTWRKGAKYFNNGSRVHGASIGKALEGPHVHMIILDDILQEFPNITDDKVIHYIKRVVMPMRLPNAKLLLVGTQKRVGDATDWVMQNKEWDTVRHPALLEDGTPRWPEYWDQARLDKERETMGSRAFESEYMLNPLDPESAVIPYEVLKPCLKEGMEMGLPERGQDWFVTMGVDLAVGMDSQNDETAYVIMAYNRVTQERKVLYCWSGKIRAKGAGWLEAQVVTMKSLADKYKPDKIMVESNGYQRLVVHTAKELDGMPVEGHNTGKEKHSHDVGVPRIALAMEQGKYFIPWNKVARESSKPGMRKLVDGLSRLIYGKHGRLEGHTPDAVMALWMCELCVHVLEKKRLVFTRWDYI